MTSLAQQLQRLAVPESRAAVSAQKRERKSLLFDPAEAAEIDRDTFYAIGVNGLQELQNVDGRFQAFESPLFDEASKSLERSVQSREVNDQLNKTIRRFLLNVSPYLLLKPAQKAIEWLVHRFHIHEYNMDELMMCVLPYHETKIFVRVVQLFNLKDQRSKWNWLLPVQKSGVSLSRLSLVTHCITDGGFLHFVCELPVLAIKAHKKTSKSALDPSGTPSDAPLRVIFSFYATTIVTALASTGRPREPFVAALVPFLVRGLKQNYPDYNGATYMIVCQLGVSATLKESLLEPLMESMCQYVQPRMLQQMLGCLAVLCQAQSLPRLPGKVMFQVCAMPQFLLSLTRLSQSHNITPLLSALLPHMTATAISAEINEDSIYPEGCEEVDLMAILHGIVKEIQVESPVITATVECLLHEYVAACGQDLDQDTREQLREKLAPIVQNLERRFPEVMDLMLETYLAEVESEDKQKHVQEFVSMYSGSAKHQLLPKANTSLVLSLNHASADVRRMAVNHIATLIKQGTEVDAFLQDSLLARLQDDAMAVVCTVLTMGEHLCDILPMEPMFDILKKLLNKWKKKQGGDWAAVVKAAVKIITSQGFASKASHLADDVVAVVIPHLFTTSPVNADLEKELLASLVASHLVSNHPLMKGIKSALSSSKAGKGSKVTAQVLDHLGKNLASFKQEQQNKMIASLSSQLVFSSRPESYSVLLTTVLLRALQHSKQPEAKLSIAKKLLEILRVDARKTCQKNVELISSPQEGDAEMGEGRDTSMQPVAVPSDALPPSLHDQLVVLLTARRKHRVAGRVYLYSAQVQAMLWALQSMVLSLTPVVPDLIPDSKWWVPGRDADPLDNQCVTFLLELVDLLTQGSSECRLKGQTKEGFRSVMESVIKNLFKDPVSFLNLLSIGWIGHVTSSKPIGFKSSPVFQVRSLGVAAAMINSLPDDPRRSLLDRENTVLPLLVVALASPLESVRGAAVLCLQMLAGGEGGGGGDGQGSDSSPFSWLVRRLLKKEDAIVMDAEYVKQALGNSLMKANNAPITTSPSKKKQRGTQTPDVKGANALQAKQCLGWILECVKDGGIPHHVQKALLQLLCLVDSEIVLESLLGMLQDLLVQAFVEEGSLGADQTQSLQCILGHVTPQTAVVLGREQSLDVFVEALGRETPPCAGTEAPAILAIKQITKDLFAALPSPDVQQRLLSRLIDLQVDTQSSAMATLVSRTIRKLPLSAAQVVVELNKINSGQKLKSVKDVRKAKQKQKQAAKEDAAQSAAGSGRPWQRVTAILENLQQRKMGKMEDKQELVPTLFTLLSLCMEMSDAEQGSSEYIKQLLLTTVLSICDHLDSEGEKPESLMEEQFSVEKVVQCIRTSDNPQTHSHALLLLAAAAKLFPEHVLHHIMAIFTFMGASLLRHDDGHSFQVIHKTVQTVIPALVKASQDQSLPSSLVGSLEDAVTMVMQTFVDAFPHIPEHRRLPLFTHLVGSVGGAGYLWRVVLLLVRGYVAKGPTAMLPEETESKGPGRNLEFWLALCNHFEPQTQVTSLIQMLAYLGTLKEKKEEGTKTPSRGTRSRGGAGAQAAREKSQTQSQSLCQDLIFDQHQHSARQLRHFQFTAVGFLSQLLTSNTFIGQIVNLSAEESSSMQALYQKLLEQTLRYITHVAHCIQDNKDPNTAKFWRALLHKAYDVLDKVNSLLPVNVFIGVVSGLLGNRLPTVRRKAMELLNNKLVQHKDGFSPKEITMLLSMVPTFVSIAKSPHETMAESAELDINRQTALYSLKLLCKLFGSDHQKTFTAVTEVALDVIEEPNVNNQVIASGLLCLAETVSSLQAHAIPYLSRFMPRLLQTLTDKTSVSSSDLHLLSTVTAIQKVLETLPHFLSPYLGQLLQQICRLSACSQEEKAQLTIRLKACRHQLSAVLPPRVLIPAVAECYTASIDSSQMSIGPLMSILNDHLDRLPKDDLLSHHHAVVTLFLNALDFRAAHPESPLEAISVLEGHVISAMITMVMKLSEATFRPLFLKISEWATRTPNPERLLTFYRLSNSFAEKLKSLFCLFAGHLVANVAQILEATNVSKKGEPMYAESDPCSEAKTSLLLGFALDCLHKCFQYDKGDFVSKERFEKLMQPLVDQLENTLSSDEAYEELITRHLTPCVVQFMVAAQDPSTWQPLNYQILLKTRNPSPKVRYAALSVLQSLHSQLGEDYLSLLPETIPFLAELMEDESEEVERHCQDVVAEFEKTLGEPLQKYF